MPSELAEDAEHPSALPRLLNGLGDVVAVTGGKEVRVPDRRTVG